MFPVLLLLAAIVGEFSEVNAGRYWEFAYCGEHRDSLAIGEFRRMFQYKETLYLVFRTKIFAMRLPHKSVYSVNDSFVMYHPRVIDNNEEELDSERLGVPDGLVAGFR